MEFHYASQTDKMHAIRKRAMHRVVSRCLRGPKGTDLLIRAVMALTEMAQDNGHSPFIEDWARLLSMGKRHVAETIIKRDDEIETLRETSPFFRVFDFDMGRSMKIVWTDEKIRSRLWKLAKNVVTMTESRHDEETRNAGNPRSVDKEPPQSIVGRRY